MDKRKRFYELKELYVTESVPRLQVFNEFFELFGFVEHWVCKEHQGFLSSMDLMANFLLALDEVITSDTTHPIEDFNPVFNRWCKEEIEYRRGLSFSIKNHLVRSKDPSVRGVSKDELRRMGVLRAVGIESYDNKEVMFEEEYKLLGEEVKTYLISKYDEKTYHDCIDHFVHGDTIRDIAKKNKMTTTTNFRKITRAWKSLKKFLKRK